jgi:hypothetical protein
MLALRQSFAAAVMAVLLSIPCAGLADHESAGGETSGAESSALEPGQARGMLSPPLRVRSALMITSWATFGVSWLAVVVTGIGGVAFEIENAGWWTVPLAGPWVMIATLHDPGDQFDPVLLFPIGMGVLQAVGLTMGVAWTIAYSKGRRRLRENIEKEELAVIPVTDELYLDCGILPGPYGAGTMGVIAFGGRF